MKRTTIMLPLKLKAKAQRKARRTGISLGEFIRPSMQDKQEPNGRKRRFFPDDFTFTDNGPRDLSANIEKYLGELREEDYLRTQSRARNGRTKKARESH